MQKRAKDSVSRERLNAAHDHANKEWYRAVQSGGEAWKASEKETDVEVRMAHYAMYRQAHRVEDYWYYYRAAVVDLMNDTTPRDNLLAKLDDPDNADWCVSAGYHDGYTLEQPGVNPYGPPIIASKP